MKVGTQIYVEGIPNTLYGQQQTFGHDYSERPKNKRKIIVLARMWCWGGKKVVWIRTLWKKVQDKIDGFPAVLRMQVLNILSLWKLMENVKSKPLVYEL